MTLAEMHAVTARTALIEKKLYKYRSLGDDIQKARLKDILLNHRIRFSRPSELNDPIEGKPILQLGNWDSVAYRAQFEEWAWGTQRNMAKAPPKDAFIQWIRSRPREHHEHQVHLINADNHAAIEERWRVLSLSATPCQELMWSHYSDGHRGVALVFDASHGEFGLALKVHYVGERVPLDVTTQNLTEVLNASILTKRSTWAYEEEYRCIAAEPKDVSLLRLDQQFMSFRPEQLLGVVFGAKTLQDDINIVLGWSADRSVPLRVWRASLNAAGAVEVAPHAHLTAAGQPSRAIGVSADPTPPPPSKP